MVTVHLGYACGEFHCLLDGELFLPEDWSADRQRCREAGIPAAMTYRPKWQIALELLDRAVGRGIHFEWLTFDEGYGGKPGFLRGLAAPASSSSARSPAISPVGSRLPAWSHDRSTAGDVDAASGPAAGRRQSRSTCRRNAPPAQIPGPTLATLAGQGWGERADDFGRSSHPDFPQGCGRLPGRTTALLVARNVLHPQEIKFFVSNAAPQTRSPRCRRWASRGGTWSIASRTRKERWAWITTRADDIWD